MTTEKREKLNLTIKGFSNKRFDDVYDLLTSALGEVINELYGNCSSESREGARSFVTDLVNTPKDMLRARLQRPVVECENLEADTSLKIESARMTQVERKIAEVRLQEAELELEEKRLDYTIQRISKLLKFLGFLQTRLEIDDDGNCTLLLTNDEGTDPDGEQRRLL